MQVNGYQTEKSVISFQNWSQPLGAPDFWVRPWSMWATIPPPQFHSRSQTGRRRQWEMGENKLFQSIPNALKSSHLTFAIRAFMVGAPQEDHQHWKIMKYVFGDWCCRINFNQLYLLFRPLQKTKKLEWNAGGWCLEVEVAGVSGQLWASRACSSWPVVVILSWAVVGVALVIWTIGH